jgi:hypothetical protein
MTSDMEWDPSQYDKDLADVAAFYDPSEEDPEERHFDPYGEYWHRTVAIHHTCCEEEFYHDQVDDLLNSVYPEIVSDIYGIHSSESPRSLQISTCFVPCLAGLLQTPSNVRLVLQLSMPKGEFPTTSNNTGVPGFPLAM